MKKTSIMLNCKLFKFTTATVILIITGGNLFAQGGGGPIPPHVLPLTGGIGALLAIGISAGVYFYRNKKSKKK